MHWFLKFIFGIKLYMFRTVPLSIIRRFWHIPLVCAQSKTPDDGQRNCPKHVEFYSKSKFEELLYLVGFIIKIYHVSRSSERQSIFLYFWALIHIYISTVNGINIKRCVIKRHTVYIIHVCYIFITYEYRSICRGRFEITMEQMPDKVKENVRPVT
jgi:hypothetical protein